MPAEIVLRMPRRHVAVGLDRSLVAATVAWLALEAPYITGQILAVDGGRSLSFPGG